MQSETMDLSNIARGAINEAFTEEFKKVLENILDPNTPAKKKRKITISLEFTPNEKRDQAIVNTVVKSTIVPAESVDTIVAIGRTKSQAIIAQELMTQAVGQLEITNNGNIEEPGTKIIFKKEEE